MLLFSILFRCARWFFMLHFSPSSAHFSHILRIQTFLSFRRLCSATLSVTTFAVGSIQCGSYVYSGDRFLLLLLLLRMEFSGDSSSKTDLHKKKPREYLNFTSHFLSNFTQKDDVEKSNEAFLERKGALKRFGSFVAHKRSICHFCSLHSPLAFLVKSNRCINSDEVSTWTVLSSFVQSF